MRTLLTLLILVTCIGCTTDAPRMTRINGSTRVQTDHRFLGMKMRTTSETVKTKEQQLDDLEVEKVRREDDQNLKTEERQSAAAFWFGVIMFAVAAGSVFAGYICSGWKFWGGMAAVAGALGCTAWGFEHLVPHLKYGAYALAGMAVLWTMWKLKDFDLINRLKHSEAGELLGKLPATHAMATAERGSMAGMQGASDQHELGKRRCETCVNEGTCSPQGKYMNAQYMNCTGWTEKE